LKRSRALVTLLLAALAAALLATGCGGGGGGGGTPTGPPPPTPGITFTPAASAGSPGISLASGAGTTATVLQLEVRATGVRDLYGAAFNLQFPASLQFVRALPGPTFAGGTIQSAVATPGNLVVGVSLLGVKPGLTGDGLIATLEFQATAAGSGSFVFSRNSALDSHGAAISGISWAAGSVQVVL